jgi:DNA-binding Xre family transcriptional regulator
MDMALNPPRSATVARVVVRTRARDLLASALRRELERRGISQAELARRVGRTQAWISRLLKKGGDTQGTTLATLDQICDALEMDPGELLPVTSPDRGSASAEWVTKDRYETSRAQTRALEQQLANLKSQIVAVKLAHTAALDAACSNLKSTHTAALDTILGDLGTHTDGRRSHRTARAKS